MNIKRVTVHGFKSYEDTVSFGPFSNGLNALVGLNGSGKSNFYKAVEFVLLDEYAHIRVGDRKQLLHESAGKSAASAFVEIIFDNSSRSIAIDKDEVSIRRSISLKKDEYFIDRKHSTWQEIRNLLESAGFSPTSGYYIVRQGKVDALTKMKDEERLDLMMDISGTKFYDEQRGESLRMLDESNDRANKIKKALDDILVTISQLEKETEELEAFEKLDSSRRAAEYLLQKIELERIESEIAQNEATRSDVSARVMELRTSLEQYKTEHKGGEDKQNELQHAVRELEQVLSNVRGGLDNANREHVRLEREEKELHSKLDNAERDKALTQDQIASTEQYIQEAVSLLNEKNQQLSEIASQKAAIEGELVGLQQLTGGKSDDTETMRRTLASAQSDFEQRNAIYNRLQTESVEHTRSLLATTELVDKVDSELKALHEREHQMSESTLELRNKRVELWRKGASADRRVRKATDEVEQERNKMQRSIPRDIAQGLQALRETPNQFEGIIGPLYELMDFSPEYAAALGAIANRSIFEIVVDTAEHTGHIINFLEKGARGRLDFIALDETRDTKYEGGPETTCLASVVNATREDAMPAIKNVFGRVALCKTNEEALEVMNKYHITCVTLEGDVLRSRGSITGGYRSGVDSILSITARINQAQQKLAEAVELQGEMKAELEAVEEQIKQAELAMHQLSEEIVKTKSEKNKLHAERRTLQDATDKCESSLEDCQTRLEESRRRVQIADKQLEAISTFKSAEEADNFARLQNLKVERDAISKTHYEQIQQRSELTSKLQGAKARLKHFREVLNSLKVERLTTNIDRARQKMNELEGKITRYQERIVDADSQSGDRRAELRELEDRLSSVKSQMEDTESELDREESQLNTSINKITLLQESASACLKSQKDIGTLPETEISEMENLSYVELDRTLRRLNEDAKSYRHVNKKAQEQYRQISEHKADLERRQQELDNESHSIRTLMETLDQKKDQAIQKTFFEISKHFETVFKGLVPNGAGSLIMQRHPETGVFTGISISVRFEGMAEPMALSQLSGGQRALVAISMIFAIQRFSPAPFYLFDEIDSALDPQHRDAVSRLLNAQSHNAGANNAQVILTTFRPELLNGCDKYFGIQAQRGRSEASEIDADVAMRIVTDDAPQNE